MVKRGAMKDFDIYSDLEIGSFSSYDDFTQAMNKELHDPGDWLTWIRRHKLSSDISQSLDFPALSQTYSIFKQAINLKIRRERIWEQMRLFKAFKGSFLQQAVNFLEGKIGPDRLDRIDLIFINKRNDHKVEKFAPFCWHLSMACIQLINDSQESDHPSPINHRQAGTLHSYVCQKIREGHKEKIRRVSEVIRLSHLKETIVSPNQQFKIAYAVESAMIKTTMEIQSMTEAQKQLGVEEHEIELSTGKMLFNLLERFDRKLSDFSEIQLKPEVGQNRLNEHAKMYSGKSELSVIQLELIRQFERIFGDAVILHSAEKLNIWKSEGIDDIDSLLWQELNAICEVYGSTPETMILPSVLDRLYSP